MAELGQYLYEKNEIVLTTWENQIVGPSYYSYPQAIRGTNKSSGDYFEWLAGAQLNFTINDGAIKITSGLHYWYSGSTLKHNYFTDNVSEL